MSYRIRAFVECSDAVESTGTPHFRYFQYERSCYDSRQALLALPLPCPLNFIITPYIPVPDTNGEEWDRMPPEPALKVDNHKCQLFSAGIDGILQVLVSMIIEGEFGGVSLGTGSGGPDGKDGMELRGAGVKLFEVCGRGRLQNM